MHEERDGCGGRLANLHIICLFSFQFYRKFPFSATIQWNISQASKIISKTFHSWHDVSLDKDEELKGSIHTYLDPLVAHLTRDEHPDPLPLRQEHVLVGEDDRREVVHEHDPRLPRLASEEELREEKMLYRTEQ